MQEYNVSEVEKKWQKVWADKKVFKAQKDLINDLVKCSNATMILYDQLIQKIDIILNHSWEAKK